MIKKTNFFKQLIIEDAYKTLLIAKAMKAIIGAVYMDGGQIAAEEVAKTLGLCLPSP